MNELEKKVLELVGESVDSPDVFVDTDAGMKQIRDSLNDAIQEIIMLTGGYKRQYMIPLREDQAFYRFNLQNGGFGWVTDAWSTNRNMRLEQTDLTRVVAHDPRWMITSGFPEAYLQVGMDMVGFYPKPSGDSDIIEITLVEIPEQYVLDTDRIKLKDSFKYAAVNYAVGEYWASRGDANEARKHGAMYLESLGLRKDFAQFTDRAGFARTRKEPWPTGQTA